MRDAALRRDLGAAARRSVLRRFGRATIAGQVASLYSHCTEERKRGGSKFRAAEAAG